MKRMTGGIMLIALVLAAAMASVGCTETAGEAVCDNMEGEAKDHCYQQFAVQTQDVGYCDKIVEAGPASKCYIFLAEKSPFRCNEMVKQPWYGRQGAYDVETCWQYVATKTKFGDYCMNIPHDFSSWGNDLAPGQVSAQRCLIVLGCGLPGDTPCKTSFGTFYCIRFEESGTPVITEYTADHKPNPFECS